MLRTVLQSYYDRTMVRNVNFFMAHTVFKYNEYIAVKMNLTTTIIFVLLARST